MLHALGEWVKSVSALTAISAAAAAATYNCCCCCFCAACFVFVPQNDPSVPDGAGPELSPELANKLQQDESSGRGSHHPVAPVSH